VRRAAPRTAAPGRRAEPRPVPLPPRIALIGLMGSGKSTVGRRLARRLGWRFVDMDAEIARTAGTSIPRLFAESGEAAFRRREVALLDRLARGQRLVVATGGGVVTSAAARARLRRHFRTFWLDLSAARAWERLGTAAGRPLLEAGPGGTPLGRLRRLARERRPLYARVGERVPVGALSPAAVVDRLLARLGTVSA
jgi:shikimate kinase